MISAPQLRPVLRVGRDCVKSKCPYFSSRVDYRNAHVIACVNRAEGINGAVKTLTPGHRDQYYLKMCCDQYAECVVRRAIQMSLQVKHPGTQAAYSVYTELLNGE